MRTLKEVLGGYSPKSPDEKRFVAKHKVKKHDDVAGNDDKLYKASNVTPVDRESPENHGYNPGSDEEVYEGKTPSVSDKSLSRYDAHQIGRSACKMDKHLKKEQESWKKAKADGWDARLAWREKRGLKGYGPLTNETEIDGNPIPEHVKNPQPVTPQMQIKAKRFADLLSHGKPQLSVVDGNKPALKSEQPESSGKKIFRQMMNPKEDTEMRQLDPHIQTIVEAIMRAKNPTPGRHPGPAANDAEEKLPLSTLKSSGTGSKMFSHEHMAGSIVWASHDNRILGTSNRLPKQKDIDDGYNFYKHNGDHLVRITKGT